MGVNKSKKEPVKEPLVNSYIKWANKNTNKVHRKVKLSKKKSYS